MKKRIAKKICTSIAKNWRNSFRYSKEQHDLAKSIYYDVKRDPRDWVAPTDDRYSYKV